MAVHCSFCELTTESLDVYMNLILKSLILVLSLPQMTLKSSTFLNNLLHIAAEQYDFIVGGGGGCHRRNLGVGARWANVPSIIFLLKNSLFWILS
jgi:hypothetical protein